MRKTRTRMVESSKLTTKNPLLWRRGGEGRTTFQEQSFSLLSFRVKGNEIEKSIIETKSGIGKLCEPIDLSTSSRGQTMNPSVTSGHLPQGGRLKLSLRACTACTLEGANKKVNSTKVPLNKGESEERAGGFFSFSKINHGPLDTSYGKLPRHGKLAFTLVELIVVIVIVGVLATVGFLAFADYPKQARDVVRISNLKEIEKALEFYKIQDGGYPIPTGGQINTGEIEGYSGIIWYKGTFGEDLTNQIQEITKTPLDPKTKAEYTYELTPDKQGYRLTANLEIKNADTGKKEHTVNNKITYPNSCAQILEDGFSTGDGNYIIRPNGQEIEVKCDMTNGGYTRYLHIKGNYTFQNAKDCWLGNIVSNTNIDCFNPNRFGMYAKDFRIIQTKSGTTNTYTYINSRPKPSINYVTNAGIGVYKVYCLGGLSYMSINKSLKAPKIDASDTDFISLGLKYCDNNNNPKRELGSIWNADLTTEIHPTMSGIKYMNYSEAGKNGPAPINRSIDRRETSVNPLEIYIR